jgi:hypothetical protein
MQAWYYHAPSTHCVPACLLSCILLAQDPDNYRNVFFTRQFLGFGLDRKGSAVSDQVPCTLQPCDETS